jgi:F-type H+-transporting ATPase subunit delta
MQGNNVVSNTFLNPYAEAMMSVAQSQNLLDKFNDNCNTVLQVLNDSADLQQFVESPIVKATDKKAVIQKVFGESVDPMMLNLIMVLVDRGRISFLSGVCQQYQVMLRKLRGDVLAEVTTAVALTEDQASSIKDRVKAMTGANNVDIMAKIEPTIVGGVIIKVGSQIIDSSLRSQLRLIGMSLAR